MNLSTRHIGSFGGAPAKFIELNINTGSTVITEDVTDLNGYVDEEFIQSLRNIADELEDQNTKMNEL